MWNVLLVDLRVFFLFFFLNDLGCTQTVQRMGARTAVLRRQNIQPYGSWSGPAIWTLRGHSSFSILLQQSVYLLISKRFCPLIAGTCEQQVACLNEELTITCTAESDHQWTGTFLSCTNNAVTVFSSDPVGTVFQCGNASIEVLEGGSRLTVTADSSLDGATVVCRDANTIVDAVIDVIGM